MSKRKNRYAHPAGPKEVRSMEDMISAGEQKRESLTERPQADTSGIRQPGPAGDCEEISREDYLIVKKTALRGAAIFFLYLFFLVAAVYAAYRAGYHMAVMQSDRNIIML